MNTENANKLYNQRDIETMKSIERKATQIKHQQQKPALLSLIVVI